MVRPRTPLLTLLALCGGATAACGADPAPSVDIVQSSTGGVSASGGAAQAFTSIPPVVASSGGVTEPAAGSTTGGSETHFGGSGAGGTQHASGGLLAVPSDFEQRCHASATDDCAHCVCDECAPEAEACELRPGCAEIAACVLSTGCVGAACFCGAVDTLRCLSGAALGPCKDVILSAPGGRSPTLADPSAGPAADAAVALGECAEPPSGVCGAECS